MVPVAFAGCAGWFHEDPSAAPKDVAVLVCPATLMEAQVSYASVRVLADRFASAGYRTLRCDYPGTADSRDLADGEELWSAWRGAVGFAADELKSLAGVSRLVLCGVRLGASLAVLTAAERDDVEGLVLFDPVFEGRPHVRQMLLDADLQGGAAASRDQGFVVRELAISPETVRGIEGLDLRKVALRPGLKVALYNRPGSRGVEPGVEAWQAAGVQVDRFAWDAVVTLLGLPELVAVPFADFGPVAAWLSQAIPAGAGGPAADASRLSGPREFAGCIESPVLFGSDRRLYGVLCRPSGTTLVDRVVIIGNAGRDPRFGGARSNVEIARALARAGIASFRMDFSGIGDSRGTPGLEDRMSDVFWDRRDDLLAAVDELADRGFRRFAVQGLCSGAYHAFHAALDDPRIDALVLINLTLFSMPEMDTLTYLDQRGVTPRTFLHKLRSRGSWRTLLSGRSRLRRTGKSFLVSLWLWQAERRKRLRHRLGLDAAPSFALQAMAQLDRQGVSVLFLFSPGDADINEFRKEFGHDGERLSDFPRARFAVVPGMDHDVTVRSGRVAATALIAAFLADAGAPRSAAAAPAA